MARLLQIAQLGHPVLRKRISSIEDVCISGTQDLIDEYSDFIARVFQHEFDHIEGIMFLDRLETTKDIMMEKEWLKLILRQGIAD